MFSHAPADRPSPSDAALGDHALDARWRAATAGWRPSSVRSVDPGRTWAWVRHAWEDLLQEPVPGTALDGDARSGAAAQADVEDAAASPGRGTQDLFVVAALLALQDRFWAVAAGEPMTAEVPDPRGDGAPLGDEEVLAVVRRTWEIDPQEAEEDPAGFAAEVSGFFQDHLEELADEVQDRLLARRGPTQVFAELWSLDHADELGPAPERDDRTPFPLSTDDTAWIVSGVPGPEKHTAWEWLTR